MNCSFLKRIRAQALLQGFRTMQKLGRTPPPKTVIWECTLACTMDCIHCGAGGKSGSQEELSTGEIREIIDDLAGLGVRRFLATGGEPLLRPDLGEVLGYANACGLETGFSTNGAGISEENVERIVRVADSIQISVDGIGRTHDRIRGSPGAFEGALRALDLLRAHRCRQTCMTSIITPFNLDEREGLYRTAKEHADLWRVGTVMPVGKAAGNNALRLSGAGMQTLLDFLAAKKGDPFPILLGENLGWLGEEYDARVLQQDLFFCGAGILSCCIGSDGRVRGCPELPPETSCIAGDLKREKFPAIWEAGFEDYRDTDERQLPAGCRPCPDKDLCRGGCRVMQRGDMHCTKKMIAQPRNEDRFRVMQ